MFSLLKQITGIANYFFLADSFDLKFIVLLIQKQNKWMIFTHMNQRFISHIYNKKSEEGKNEMNSFFIFLILTD